MRMFLFFTTPSCRLISTRTFVLHICTIRMSGTNVPGVGDFFMSNRDALLLAAKKCLLEKGFNRTTARDIASEAGVSLAAIGYHFSSKEALLTEALLLACGDWDKDFRRLLNESVPT